ncbi:hypothetical protein PRNP1_005833 [Phytophthora ramorum]
MLRTTLGPVSSAQLNTRTAVLRHPSTRVSVPNKSSASERQSIGIVSRRVSAAAGPNARWPPPGPRTSINRSVCGPPPQHVRLALFRVGRRRQPPVVIHVRVAAAAR